MLAVALAAAPAAAQQAAAVGAQGAASGKLCRIFASEPAQDQPRELVASCRGHGLLLGSATRFEAIDSEALQATLVDIQLGSERRILLLSFPEGDRPLVEDLSGQIALAAGRGPMSELAGVELDLKSFARGGEIRVQGRPEDTGRARTDRINLGQQVALERSRRMAAASNPLTGN
jgi:hypothetical protein